MPPVAEQDAVDQGFDHRPVEHLDAIFAIADRHGCGLDIHLHDGGKLGAVTFDLIVERTHVLGLAGKVTVSHAFALAEVSPLRLERLVDDVADQRILLTTVVPATGRPSPGQAPGGRRGRRPRLRRHPRPVVTLGRRRPAGGAALLDLSAYGLTPGCAAHLSLVPATTPGEAVVTTHPGPWSSGPAASCDRHDNTDPAHVPCLLRRPP